MTLPLFEDTIAPGPVPVRRSNDLYFYACPGCGHEMSQSVDDEPLSALQADPACCFCRAEFAGFSFAEWRKLPAETRKSHKPPVEWRSAKVKA